MSDDKTTEPVRVGAVASVATSETPSKKARDKILARLAQKRED